MKTIKIIREALGETSAIFMAQKIKGTEIVMPTKELTEIAERTNERIMESMQAEILDLKEALIWCSGSADFGEGGQARAGWLKTCEPLLRNENEV